MKYAILFLVTSACGGSFTEAIIPPDAGHETGIAETGLPETSTEAGETGPVEAGLETSPPDAPTDAPDAPPDVTADALPDATDAGCPTLPPMHVSWCFLGGIDTPTQYCIESTSTGNYPGVSPAGCQCAATFSCACVETMTDSCGGHGTFISCTLGGPSGNVPFVQCT